MRSFSLASASLRYFRYCLYSYSSSALRFSRSWSLILRIDSKFSGLSAFSMDIALKSSVSIPRSTRRFPYSSAEDIMPNCFVSALVSSISSMAERS